MTDRKRFSLVFREHKYDPEKKAAFTDALFDEVAPMYDRFHLGAMSFFRDRHWKRWMVEQLPRELPDGPIVDLATGTGSVAFLLAEAYPEREIIGIDINREMLDRAIAQNPYTNVRFEQCDLFEMNYPAGSVACFTGGYALRNAPDLDALLEAMHQQLAPGGVAAFLEFSRPASPVGSTITLLLLRFWTGFWSLVLHGNLKVLHYIPQSLAAFPNRVVLRHTFAERGLRPVCQKSMLFGLLHVGSFVRDQESA